MTNTDTQRLEFCREVRRRRLALGLTLEQLAERSGLTPNYIGAVELGKRDPSLSTVLALARGFKVPPGEMLGSAPGLTPDGRREFVLRKLRDTPGITCATPRGAFYAYPNISRFLAQDGMNLVMAQGLARLELLFVGQHLGGGPEGGRVDEMVGLFV